MFLQQDFDLFLKAVQSAVWAACGHDCIWLITLSFYMFIFAFATIQH